MEVVVRPEHGRVGLTTKQLSRSIAGPVIDNEKPVDTDRTIIVEEPGQKIDFVPNYTKQENLFSQARVMIGIDALKSSQLTMNRE